MYIILILQLAHVNWIPYHVLFDCSNREQYRRASQDFLVPARYWPLHLTLECRECPTPSRMDSSHIWGVVFPVRRSFISQYKHIAQNLTIYTIVYSVPYELLWSIPLHLRHLRKSIYCYCMLYKILKNWKIIT